MVKKKNINGLRKRLNDLTNKQMEGSKQEQMFNNFVTNIQKTSKLNDSLKSIGIEQMLIVLVVKAIGKIGLQPRRVLVVNLLDIVLLVIEISGMIVNQ